MELNERKRPSLDSSSDEPKPKRSAVIEPLKLIHLNEHVLEHIFSYLDVMSLVNVVNSDDAFLNICRRVFKRTYKKKVILMNLKCFDDRTKKEAFPLVAQLLRYFGESMTSLEVSFDNNCYIDVRIFHLIVTCCRNTLSELKILHPTDKLRFNKAFPELRKLTFRHGRLKISSSQLFKCFPSLESLVFDSIEDVGWLLSSRRKIPTLKCLSLLMEDPYSDGHFYRIQDLHSFIAVNPQINEIDLTLSDHNIDIYIRMLPNLHNEIVPEEQFSLKLCMRIKLERYDFVRSQPLARLEIPKNHVAHLKLFFVDLTAQICDYIADCVNMKTLTLSAILNRERWNEYNAFKESSWTGLRKFELLTRLEVLPTRCATLPVRRSV
ncbi:hypothetical protein HA402_005213 [Bradysia odoriphaga]|nr:hypothetical protein HA402_005213 [Bradysia odoriphaga]